MVKKNKNLFSSDKGIEIFSSIENTISEHNMKEKLESGVLVGFSGGPDSVMLLSFLLEYRERYGEFPIVLVHINHMIRGDEADRDEAFSADVAKALGVPFVCKKIDIPALSKETGVGIEETARNARYSEFTGIISGRNDIGCIAVAHNATDNAETVIFNMLRGAGTKGASGIPPVRENIIRPLINISKEDIVSLLDDFDIPYVIDSTNAEEDYTRNFIRGRILPLFKEITPNPEKNISRLSRNLRYDDLYLQNEASEFLDNKDKVITKALSGLHRSILHRVLQRMVEPYSVTLTEKHVEAIEELLSKDNFKVSLPGGLSFVSESGVSYISDTEPTEIQYQYEIAEGKNVIPDFGAEIQINSSPVDKTFLNVHKNSIQVDISSAIIVGRLFIRPKKDGDSVFYNGMTHKLKKLFNDRKIPKSIRPLIPILCDEKGVVWVPGFGVRDDLVAREEREPRFVVLTIDNNLDDFARFHTGTEFR